MWIAFYMVAMRILSSSLQSSLDGKITSHTIIVCLKNLQSRKLLQEVFGVVLYFLILLADNSFGLMVKVSALSNNCMLLEKEKDFGVLQRNRSSKES